ncbi:hypothetical protein D3C76_664480 [compost metagenome]
MVDVELVLRLGKEYPATVIALQGFAADMHLATIALAEQQACGVFVLPAQQDGAAAFLEQQHGRHGDARDLLQLALQQAPLQAGPGGCAGQKLGAQALGGQRQAGGQHYPAGGFLVQDTQAQQTIQQGIVMLTAWIVAELDSTDFGFHAALHPCGGWGGCAAVQAGSPWRSMALPGSGHEATAPWRLGNRPMVALNRY